ncbi:MAG: hypothetical protein ACRESZ_06005 [Methylococcales bacterium]
MNTLLNSPPRFFLAVLILCLSASLSCTKQPLSEAEEKEALKERVEALWDAIIAVDFDKV